MNKSIIFVDIEVSKKSFYDSKKAIKLNLAGVNNIVVSNKVKGNNETSKYFIGYLHDISESVTPLCIILPQMSGYIKYFENGVKNMSFKIEDESVCVKYNQIWNRIKELLGVKFDTEPIYDDSFIKTKVKTCSEIVKTLFSGYEYSVEYSCLSCISIDSLLKVDKKNFPQVYLEQFKYKIMKREPKNFIDYGIDLVSYYESD